MISEERIKKGYLLNSKASVARSNVFTPERAQECAKRYSRELLYSIAFITPKGSLSWDTLYIANFGFTRNT